MLERPKKNALPRNTLMQDEFKLVPLSLIFWKTPIRDFTGEDVENMAASIMIHGQIQPIVVKQPDAEGSHEGVCGRLRYEGAKHAHRPEVLVRVHNFEDEAEALEWQLAENLHRKELGALERAEAYGKLAELRKKLFPEEKTAVKGIAMAVEELTGTKPAERTVRKYLEISHKIGNKAKRIGLPRPSEKASFPKISHLEQICRIEDEDKQAELLSQTIHGNWTVSKLKQTVDQTLGISKPKPKPIDTNQMRKGKLKRLKAQEKRLQRLKHEIADLIRDASVGLGLPKDKTPKELLKLLRRFHRIQHHECYFKGRREPICHVELYEFYKEMIRKWTLGDVEALTKNMRYFARALKLTKEKATAKTIVDMAYSYVLLYEHFMKIPNGFEKVANEKGQPVSVPSSMMFRASEESQGRKHDGLDEAIAETRQALQGRT